MSWVTRLVLLWEKYFGPGWNDQNLRRFTLDSVAFLSVKEKAKTKTATGYLNIGTCFFLSHTFSGTNYQYAYIVTCRHVVKPFLDKGETIFVRLNRNDDDDVGFVALEEGWVFHPDEGVDIAMTEINQKSVIEQKVYFGAFDYNKTLYSQMAYQVFKKDLIEGEDVFFLGMYNHYQGYRRNYPLFRKGTVALVPEEETNGVYGLTQLFYIESLAYRGFSGSPVFWNVDIGRNRKKPFLIGVVSGYVPVNEFETEVYPNKFEIVTNAGVTAVVPITKVNDIMLGENELVDKRNEAYWHWEETGDAGHRVSGYRDFYEVDRNNPP